jgi:hypothetical protein
MQVKKNNYVGAVAITPSDSANLTDAVSALYVGGSGAIKVTTFAGDTVTFLSVPAGIFEVSVTKVFSTGTTATGIFGLK